MKIYQTEFGLVVESAGRLSILPQDVTLDRIFVSRDPHDQLQQAVERSAPLSALPKLRAPIQSQEVWAAGVTYFRSRTARMAESKDGGGGSFYDKVYNAARPELFFKAAAHRVAGPGQTVRTRRDAHWNVPEPELTLAISSFGQIFGYTAGNDMSSRDIEGENPLYLPQAKAYHRAAALGPCLLVIPTPLPLSTPVELTVARDGVEVFTGSTCLDRIKRPFTELAEFLFRDNVFPHGTYLMTGTGIVPPDDFTLRSRDVISIRIEPIGTLVNTVE